MGTAVVVLFVGCLIGLGWRRPARGGPARRHRPVAAVAAAALVGTSLAVLPQLAEPAAAALPPGVGQYVPLAPARIVPNGVPNQLVDPGAEFKFTAVGVGGVPATGVAAVQFQLSTVSAGSGALVAFPSGIARPNTSTVNYRPSIASANDVMVRLGTNNQVSILNLTNTTAAANVFVDMIGYFTAVGATTAGSTYVPLSLTPQSLSLVSNTAVNGMSTFEAAPLGRVGVPLSGVTAVMAQVHVETPTPAQGGRAGFASVFPGPARPVPQTSDINYGTDVEYMNLVPVKLAPDGKFRVFVTSGVFLTIYIVGYYRDGGGSVFTGLNPVRLHDTDTTPGPMPIPVPAGGSITVPMLGRGGIPATGVTAVSYNLTSVGAGTAGTTGELIAYPADLPQRPNFPSNQFRAGIASPVQQVTKVGAGGIKIDNFGLTPVRVIVDVSGYYATTGPVPGAPTGVTAVAGNGTATVSWRAPTTGGTPTGYAVQASPGGPLTQVNGTATTAQVTGLSNGTDYTFTVAGLSSTGIGPFSAPSGTVTPSAPQPPGPPLITDVSPRDGALRVSWSAPSIGSSALTSYRITTQPATTTTPAGPDATEAVVGGLVNGQRYAVVVTAVNGVGVGVPATPSQPIAPEPATAPLAPTVTALVPGNARVTVQWVPPLDGGAPITGYTVTANPGAVTVHTAADTTVAAVPGLTNGTAYTFSVVAANSAGASEPGTAGPVTPAATLPPGAPTHVRAAVSAAGSVRVEWEAPGTAGTAAISSYTVTANPGGATATAPAAGTAATVTGLDPATGYTFTVRAVSAAGTGPGSDPTGALAPALTVAAAPIVLSPASLVTLRALRSATLEFEQPPGQVTALQPGQIIVARPAAQVPTGLLRAVTATNTTNGMFVVSTRGATMTEVLSVGSMVSDSTVDTGDVASFVPTRPGVRLRQPIIAGRTAAQGAPRADPGAAPAGVSGSVGISDGALVLEVEGSLYGDGAVPLGGKIEAQLAITPLRRHRIYIRPGGIDTEFGLSALVEGEVQAKGGIGRDFQAETPIGFLRTRCIVVQAGPLPVVICLEVTINVRLSGQLTVGMAYNASFSREFGGLLTSHNLDVDAHGINQEGRNSGTGHQAYVDASVRLGLPIEFGFFLYDAIGPQLVLQPYLELLTDTTQAPPSELRLGLSVGVTFSLSRLLGGRELLRVDDLLNFFVSLWKSGSTGVLIASDHPDQETLVREPVQFSLRGYGGLPDNVPVTWRVIEGVGAIDATGRYVSEDIGHAVIQGVPATLQAEPVLAGVNVGPNVPTQPRAVRAVTGRLSADLAWTPPASDGRSPITGYAVTAFPPIGTLRTDAATTSLHVGHLDPSVRYAFAVRAINAVGPSAAVLVGPVQPQEALIQLGGPGDVAVDADGAADTAAMAGRGGVRLSGDGRYAFFITRGTSNLAPPEVAAPGNFNLYLLRKNLGTGVIDLASRGPDGRTPQPVKQSYDPNGFLNGITDFVTFDVNRDGSVVVFIADPVAIMVHDLDQHSTWTVPVNGAADASPSRVIINDSGAVIAYTAFIGRPHLFRATSAGRTQIDTCTVGDCVMGFDMAGDGNRFVTVEDDEFNNKHLIVYDVGGGRIDLTPPVPCCEGSVDANSEPRISGDGSTVAAVHSRLGFDGLAVVRVASGRLTSFDIVAPYDGDARFNTLLPRDLSRDGRIFAYNFPNPPSGAEEPDNLLGGYVFNQAASGSVRLPGPTANHGESLLDLSDDGSLAAWTRCANPPGRTCSAGPGAWVQRYG